MANLGRSPRRYLWHAGWAVALLLLPLVVKSSYLLHMAIMIVMFAGLGAAWNIIGGYAGLLSLGHAAFFGMGAYTATLLYLNWQISPWLGCMAGMALSAIVAVVMGAASFRLTGPYFALVTLAFAEVVLIIAQTWERVTHGAEGLSIPNVGNSLTALQFSDKFPYYYIILAIMFLAIYVSQKIEKSKLGYYLIAIREEETAAACLGISVFNYKLRSLIISAVLTSLIGSFYAQYIRFIHPHSVFGFDVSLQMILVALVGGPGTALGPILGAFIIIPLSEASRALLGGGRFMGLHYMVYGLSLVLVVLFMPGGIMRYLHLKRKPSLPVGSTVRQGTKNGSGL